MNSVLELPLLGLDETFPDSMFVLFHEASNRYGCFCFEQVHGLACFSDEAGATRFAELTQLAGMTLKDVSFDEAREVAKDRPLPVVSVMLLDKLNDPLIHYIR